MLINRSRSQLIVIDIQKKLLPVIYENDRMVRRASLLMQAAERLGVPVLISEHNPKGLGATVAPIAGAIKSATLRKKMHFSCAADEFIEAQCMQLKAQGRDQLILAGIEAHICVLQTALGFAEKGYKVFIAADAVSSGSKEAAERGIERARHAGCAIADVEMIIFEGLHQAGTPEFKGMLDIIKALRANGE